METVAHVILSPYAVYLYLYMYRCVCVHIVGDPPSVQSRNATPTDHLLWAFMFPPRVNPWSNLTDGCLR